MSSEETKLGNVTDLSTNKICRSCLSSGAEMKDVFSLYLLNDGTTKIESFINDMIFCCTQVKVMEGDGLPRYLCVSCTQNVASAFVFRNQTQESDKFLREFIRSYMQQHLNDESNKACNGDSTADSCINKSNAASVYQNESMISNKKSPIKSKQSARRLKKLNRSESLPRIQRVSTRSRSKNLGIEQVLERSSIQKDDVSKDIGRGDKIEDKKNESILEPSNEVASLDLELGESTKYDRLIEDGLKHEIADIDDQSIFDVGEEDLTEIAEKRSEKKTKIKKNKVDKKIRKDKYPPLYESPEEAQTCSLCSENCSSVRELIKHRKEKHGPKKYQCLTCGNGFTTTRGLRIHLRLHSGERPEVCTTCGKAFSDPRTLKTHERIHSKSQPFPCTLCDKRFSARLPLQNHMRSHSGERPHSCPVCHKTYVQAVSLQVHMRSHTGSRPYPCEECGKAFTNTTSLSAHKLTHNGIKNFVCPVCGKRMARSGELSIHLRCHSGERPFPCTLCPKAFPSRGALNMHMPTHTGVKNFVCSVCGKRMARSMELKVHMRAHSGERRYACPHCDRKFSTSSNMRLHQRKHTGEKPYRCEQCGRSFADWHVLRNHLRTHSGERPHTCSLCGRAFSQRATLRTHLNTHHRAGQKINSTQDNKPVESSTPESVNPTRKTFIDDAKTSVKIENTNSTVQNIAKPKTSQCFEQQIMHPHDSWNTNTDKQSSIISSGIILCKSTNNLQSNIIENSRITESMISSQESIQTGSVDHQYTTRNIIMNKNKHIITENMLKHVTSTLNTHSVDRYFIEDMPVFLKNKITNDPTKVHEPRRMDSIDLDSRESIDMSVNRANRSEQLEQWQQPSQSALTDNCRFHHHS